MVLTKDEEGKVREIISCLDKEIEEKGKELEKEKSLKYQLQKKLWDHFSCPLGKTNEDAICPECLKALAKVGTGWSGKDHTLWFQLPPGMSKELVKKCEKNKVGCTEWEKKARTPACGCGGDFLCECGYEDGFCSFTGEEKICPFCGRMVKVTFSGMHELMAKINFEKKE